MSSVRNNHCDIQGLTELENSFLKDDPVNAITFLQVKYSNNHSVYTQLNKYIDAHELTKHTDKWHRQIIFKRPFFDTDNEYMILAIETDNVTLFEPIFTHEIQKVMLDSLKMKDYVMAILNDCINHDAYACIEHITKNDYTKDVLRLWLVSLSLTRYWFPSIARHGRIINLLFISTGVIDHMRPLERNYLGCMITESAIRMCNTKVFKWCISTFWRSPNGVAPATWSTIDYLNSEYAKEPYLNEKHLEMYRKMTE